MPSLEMGEIARNTAGAALAGLAPHPNQSGTRNGYRRIQGGRPEVKRLLFMTTGVDDEAVDFIILKGVVPAGVEIQYTLKRCGVLGSRLRGNDALLNGIAERT